MKYLHIGAKSFLSLFFLLFYTSFSSAETVARPYKISLLVFKHVPANKNTSNNTLSRWTEKTFIGSTELNTTQANDTSIYDILLPEQASELAGSYAALLHDPHYQILYHGTWITQFQYGQTRSFHFHKNINNNIFDGLFQITMKYYFDIHFQSQLLTPTVYNNYHYYTIDALDEVLQISSKQLEYVDGPIYSALILITHYNPSNAYD